MGRGLSWQEGYGTFRVSASQLEVVKRRIQNRDVHHHKRDFEEEFPTLKRVASERCTFGAYFALSKCGELPELAQ
jgi:hypothetical protein